MSFLKDRPMQFETEYTVDDMKEALFSKGVYRVQNLEPEDSKEFKQISIYLTGGLYRIVHENSRKGNKILDRLKSFSETVSVMEKLGFTYNS